jgi:hypothetical protein
MHCVHCSVAQQAPAAQCGETLRKKQIFEKSLTAARAEKGNVSASYVLVARYIAFNQSPNPKDKNWKMTVSCDNPVNRKLQNGAVM